MVFFQPRFPTPALKRLETKFRSLLRSHLEESRSCPCWESPQQFKSSLQGVLQFAAAFQKVYVDWEREASKQFEAPVLCAKGCSNCCQHYPMSVEPFELIYLYVNIRNRSDFPFILEECFRRVQAYAAFMRKQDESLPEEERENIALHQYFEAGLRCPLIAQDGGCSVHAFRPITCRMYFSFSDPKYCTPNHLLTPENKSFHLCLPDEVEEDFAEWKERFIQLGLSESLYEGLLQLNTWEQDQVFP